MFTVSHHNDQVAREVALDPTQSFIVQASAGSGKTSLLTMRLLVLLAHASLPEECLAITFTKKAANEMRERVLGALRSAQEGQVARTAYEGKIQDLARAVLIRDEKMRWNLLENSHRLKIQTIDALCASLTRQLPILTHFGALPQVTENPNLLYQQAAENLLDNLETEEYWAESLHILLRHLDNNIDLAKHLLFSMLPYRDQWLPMVGKIHEEQEARLLLEKGLQEVIHAHLHLLRNSMPNDLKMECLELLQFSMSFLSRVNNESLICACVGLNEEWPDVAAQNLNQWLGVSEFLTTKEGKWRQQVTAQQGFPSVNEAMSQEEKQRFKAMKIRMKALLKSFAEYPDLLEKFNKVRLLPNAQYQEIQWTMIRSLITLLPVLVAHLTVVFREKGMVDFIEIAMAAAKALGESENPTDLALALDYKLQHILVDEFQDTSISQFRLLEKLTANWADGDGKTIFLVGDPMQSIYRFRQAEVGLFLSVKNIGKLNNIAIHYLCLTKNFRSDIKLVEWCNRIFSQSFPNQDNIANGAISFVPSEAVIEKEQGIMIDIHPIWGNDWQVEADTVVRLIQETKECYPNQTIAVLVRSRNHVQSIIQKLRARNIPYQGVEIESLLYSQQIQDLLSLTKALLCLEDRVAWLSILRAPWIGLSLHDLHLLANQVPAAPLWTVLENGLNHIAFSEDGRIILERATSVLKKALAQRCRVSLRDWVFATWRDLGGLQYVPAHHISDVQLFFELLEQHDRETEGLWSGAQLEKDAKTLYLSSDSDADQVVQIMTIHKAKGLEFDTVILPGLGRRTMAETDKLLLWYEHLSEYGQSHLVFAPIKAQGGEVEQIYTYLKKEALYRDQLESMRLLYVGCTRAKVRLHLVGHIPIVDSKEKMHPLSNSLLSLLWHSIEVPFLEKISQQNTALVS